METAPTITKTNADVKLMTIEKLRPTYTFTQERLAALQAVVPEAFADGRINWERLHEALGDYLEAEEADAEHFGLTWPGKRAARRLAATPSPGTLRPAPGEGIDEATTRNLFIEGDNLEVLKLLQKSYAGRVKLIYIDPPYNTGNDFIYKDNFTEPLESYLRRTGQTGEEGELLTTNPKAGGRFHSNWLNMIYPRLLLARQLLRDDGVIFVSIDDNELHNLRNLMDEIFGSENFIGVFVWQSKKGGGSDNAGVVRDQEYIVCYSKQTDSPTLSRVSVESEKLDQADEKGPYRLGRELNKWGANSRREDRPTMFFPIPGPNGEDVYPIRNDGKEGRWRLGKSKMFAIVQKGDAEFVKRPNGTYIVYEKIRSTDPRSKPYRTWLTNVGTTADGSKTVKDIFGGDKVFDFAKPVDLIQQLLDLGTTGEGDIVMDFFAGSATLAHATLEQNRKDEFLRQFICVQIPEPTNAGSEAYKVGYYTIAEIGKERIRRVSQRMKQEAAGKLLTERETPEDLGFKLGRSHFKAWSAEAAQAQAEDPGALPTLFDAVESPLVDDWQPEDLLVEILLQEGFPLDSRITMLEFYQQNWVWQVESEACAHRLFLCLDARLHADTIAGAERIANGLFICLDTALSDEEKLRLADKCRLKVI